MEWVRWLQLVEVIVILGLVTVAGLQARVKRNEWRHPSLTRLTFIAMWLLAAMTVYSASSFLWAEAMREWLDVIRYAPLTVRTVTVVLLLGVVLYLRRIRRDT
jgi:predicted cation transporter